MHVIVEEAIPPKARVFLQKVCKLLVIYSMQAVVVPRQICTLSHVLARVPESAIRSCTVFPKNDTCRPGQGAAWPGATARGCLCAAVPVLGAPSIGLTSLLQDTSGFLWCSCMGFTDRGSRLQFSHTRHGSMISSSPSSVSLS